MFGLVFQDTYLTFPLCSSGILKPVSGVKIILGFIFSCWVYNTGKKIGWFSRFNCGILSHVFFMAQKHLVFVAFRFFFLLIRKSHSGVLSVLKRMMKDSSDFGGSQWDVHISQLRKISIWKSGISLYKQHLISVAELRLALYVQYAPKQFFRPLSSHFLEIIYLTDG